MAVASTTVETDWANRLNGALELTFNGLISKSADLVHLAQFIGGLGALVYIAYHIWVAMLRNEPVDFMTMVRPLVIGVIIALFPYFLWILNELLGIITLYTHELSQLGKEEHDQLYQNVKEARDLMFTTAQDAINNMDTSIWDDLSLVVKQLRDDVGLSFKMWLVSFVEFIFNAASVCINILRTFHLLILGIFGPIIFGLAIWEGLKGGIQKWFTLYIQTFMWLPVCHVLQMILFGIQNRILQAEINDYNRITEAIKTYVGTNPEDITKALGHGVNVWPGMLFDIVGITTILAVPTLSKYIVEAGAGVGAANRKIQQGLGGMANNRGTRAVAAAAGQRLGRAAGGGFGGSVARSFLRGARR